MSKLSKELNQVDDNELFHHLWTKAVGTSDYIKAEWNELGNRLGKDDLLTAFEQLVIKHSLLPGNLLYNSNALCGEAGEAANIVKKLHMLKVNPDWEDNKALAVGALNLHLMDELGDILFQLTRMALDMGIDLETLMDRQEGKLRERSHEYKRTFLK